ncbi:ABC transporter permease [candidate division GN15 bacterium]|uniref:ABC transporter permease n=1 Tax=candidate division GN15 bacterium TaxID=2072418 RepID=A0A855X4E1_9BACT|nr:MAG: ABC transporter permease [candidate division GN15 bacterium]
MRQIKFIAQKEMYHILRDFRSLIIIFVMPVMMTFLYGYAINMDIEHIPLTYVDKDNTPESRALIDRILKSGYFFLTPHSPELSDPDQILRASHAAGFILIRPGFAKALNTGEPFELGLIIDGSEVSQAAAVQSYSNVILNQFLLDRLPPETTVPGVKLSQQVLFNPDLQSSHFFVPGIVAIILLMISALLTSITIAREKEMGTLEQLLTAPVTPTQILIGKLLPYIVIAFLDGLLVLIFAKLLFGVPFVGSFPLLLGFELIYVTTALSIGILISTAVPTQQLAMQFALLLTMLPTIMLSGFMFAIKNMPIPLQIISRIVPATYFLKMIRGIMLKGSGFAVLAPQAGFLALLMILFLFLAIRRFKTRIG